MDEWNTEFNGFPSIIHSALLPLVPLVLLCLLQGMFEIHYNSQQWTAEWMVSVVLEVCSMTWLGEKASQLVKG